MNGIFMCRPGSEIARTGSPSRTISAWLVCGTVNSENKATTIRAKASSAITPPALNVIWRLRLAPASNPSACDPRGLRAVTLLLPVISISTPARGWFLVVRRGRTSSTRIGVANKSSSFLPPLIAAASQRGLLIGHTAHTAHAAARHTGGRTFLLRPFGDHGFRGDQKPGDRRCIL